jgi:hypothetical protein
MARHAFTADNANRAKPAGESWRSEPSEIGRATTRHLGVQVLEGDAPFLDELDEPSEEVLCAAGAGDPLHVLAGIDECRSVAKGRLDPFDSVARFSEEPGHVGHGRVRRVVGRLPRRLGRDQVDVGVAHG